MNSDGSIAVEYAVVLALVSVGAIGALVAVGSKLVRLSAMQQAWIELPIP